MKIAREDLAQMTLPYLKSLDHETLVDISFELRNVAIDLLERLDKNSKNSSKPPSSDDPYKKEPKDKESENSDDGDIKDEDKGHPEKTNDDLAPEPEKRNPGRQPGSQGFWRSETPVPEQTIPHYPEQCHCCNKKLNIPEKASPYMGYYVFELEKTGSGIRIFCCLHHYYIIMCECGQEVKASPGQGYVSKQDGRKKDLKLTEYVMTGPMLATFIAALSSRYRMSRPKIREFLMYWFGLELSVGTIDRCIREAGVACFPVVEELIDQLQKENIVHLDETPWKEKGALKWMWVAISCTIAIYIIGTRKKEELLKLITEAFVGWLITDGYMAYRDYEKRQRCLAHLIRKAIALTGAVDKKAQKMGDWLLKELRGLIKTMADGGEDSKKICSPILARLKKACNLGAEEDHAKLKSLAKEILRDWDAVVAFVKNPDLPPTNNEAERALRHAVISKRISFGTRSTEGSKAYAALLSVIETCRLRNQNPWDFISQVIALGRKGIAPASIPMPA